jgi:hypothetical protein
MLSVPELFRHARVAPPRQSAGLQVFGLRVEAPPAAPYETLDEAMGRHDLEVTEVSEGGSVPTLRLVNKSDSRVFLMAGEHLVGAKQNRVLNTSLMVAGHSEVPIPVSCVEQGRWAYRSRGFSSHGSSSHSTLRKKMTRSVTESYLACAAPHSDQGEVWDEVNRKLGAMGSVSGSHALEQTYEDTRPRLDAIEKELTAPAGCNGAVFVLHGRVVGLDLFDRPETLAKLWPKLVRAYAIDALETPEAAATPLDAVAVEAWLKQAEAVEPKSFPSPGLGEDVRLKSADVVGAGLVVEQAPIHVQLFAETRA